MHFSTLLLGLLGCCSISMAQAPNTLYQYNPNSRTGSYNGTWVIIPIDDANLTSIISPYTLIPVPRRDKTLYPRGFPAGKHPILVTSGLNNDIRQAFSGVPLFIQALFGADCFVPYVDRLGDGKTAFRKPCGQFLGGLNGNDVQTIIPALVASGIESATYPATFDPNNAAWRQNDARTNSLSMQQIVVPNTVSGPGVYRPVMDIIFSANAAGSKSKAATTYTPHTFHSLYNQPIINELEDAAFNGLTCTRQNCYFNWSFTDSTLRSADVTLYGATADGGGALPISLNGQYNAQGAYTATCEVLGQYPENCTQAAMLNDPKASK